MKNISFVIINKRDNIYIIKNKFVCQYDKRIKYKFKYKDMNKILLLNLNLDL